MLLNFCCWRRCCVCDGFGFCGCLNCCWRCALLVPRLWLPRLLSRLVWAEGLVVGVAALRTPAPPVPALVPPLSPLEIPAEFGRALLAVAGRGAEDLVRAFC